MYNFVVHQQPLPETVALVEDIVVEYVTDLVSLDFFYFLFANLVTFPHTPTPARPPQTNKWKETPE